MAEFDKGAHFFSCDLQVHSPLDERWKGLGKGGDDQTKQYARELLTACRSVGLQAVAITDHHEMGFVSALRQAAADERDEEGKPLNKREQLIVFPGMELTLGVPCQALLIFDADFPDDLFSLAMNALTIAPGNFRRLDYIQSFVKLKEELDKHTYLKNRYVVFPTCQTEERLHFSARVKRESTSRCHVKVAMSMVVSTSLEKEIRTFLPVERKNMAIAA